MLVTPMRAVIACMTLGLLAAPGCEAPLEDEGIAESRSHSTCRRRSDYPTLLALNELDASGNPSISGPKARLSANTLMTISGAADIEADLFTSGELVINGNPNIDGDIEESQHELQVADDPWVDFVKTYNHNWRIPCVARGNQCRRYLDTADLTLNSQETLTLWTGVYYFDSIKISGNAALQTIGNVWIYVDGTATFNGGATWSENYDTLTLVSGSDETITINGAAEAAMHVFAPHATVKLAGTSGFAGSITAYDIVLSGTTDLWLTPGSLARNCPPLDGNYG